jgi:hypothetical protein
MTPRGADPSASGLGRPRSPSSQTVASHLSRGPTRPHSTGVSPVWFVFKSLAVTAGAFAQVAFFAAMTGARLSQWPHVALTTALALPFLHGEDGPAAPIPADRRGARVREAISAGAAVLYISLTLAVLALAAFGVSPKDRAFLISAPAIGCIPVGVDLLRAARRLRRPRPPAPEPPFTGHYRIRPPAPLAPDPPVPPLPPPPARPVWIGPLGMALTSAAFVVAGLVIARSPRLPSDGFWGLLSASFFGLCAWVFVEQLASGSQVLAKRAGLRVMAALVAASLFACHLAWTTTVVSLPERLLVGGGAAALTVLGVLALGRAWRRDDPRRARGSP